MGGARPYTGEGRHSTAEEAAGAFDAAVVKLRGLAQSNLNIPVAVAVQPSASVTLVKAEEHGDGVDAVERRGKKALPDAQTKFALVHTLAVAGRNYGKKPRFFQQLEPLHGPAGTAKQVTERQEVIQHRFLEVVDKREQDRMIREEAWRRHEMARLAHERAMAATHNAAVLSYIQKFTGQCIPMPSIAAVPIRFMPLPSSRTHATPIFYATASPPSSQPPSPRPLNPPTRPPAGPQPQKSPASATVESPQQQAPVVHQSSTDIMTPAATPHDRSGGGGGAASSSLWFEAEVYALIQLRTNLDMHRNGRPLWEEVSAGMLWMGYNRSSQRCMEKWGNMNMYFNKTKESNKTSWPSYFHQLEALHRNKAALGSPAMPHGASGSGGRGSRAASSSLWTMAEVHALIQVQTNLDMRRKGPLWEEISAGMRRMGYSRRFKECMDKWRNY
ncbi:hypothetical protein ACQ4PT_060104 [Festuca glaucescens]